VKTVGPAEVRDQERGARHQRGGRDIVAAGGDAPIPFDELVETSSIALHVEDLIHGHVERAEP